MMPAVLTVALAGACPPPCLCVRDAEDLPAVVLAAVHEADAVLLGRVIDTRHVVDRSAAADDWLEVDLRVETRWKGPHAATVRVRTPLHAALCGFPFERQQEYIVFAHADTAGTLRTHACTRTRSRDRAADDIRLLRRVIGVGLPSAKR